MGNEIPQYLITNSSIDSSSTLLVTAGIPSIQSDTQIPTLDEFIRALCIMSAVMGADSDGVRINPPIDTSQPS